MGPAEFAGRPLFPGGKPQRFPLLAAGIFGATGVALGALGAHRLEPLLAERGMAHAWETGSRYHMFHAVAFLGLAALAALTPPGAAASRLRAVAWCWTVGVVLFSGSLYWLALVGPRPYAIVFATPLGGLSLLVGWVLLIAAALRTTTAKP
jgi:uncharacterized membrane protein YgdD (TMEM256/DUF423 family)